MEFQINTYGYFADRDMLDAKLVYKLNNELLFDNIVVRLQQALEKILKQYLTENLSQKDLQAQTSKHKLHHLYKNVEGRDETDEIIKILMQLSESYFEKRYPGDYYTVTDKEEVDYLLGKSEQIFYDICSRIIAKRCNQDIKSKEYNIAYNLSMFEYTGAFKFKEELLKYIDDKTSVFNNINIANIAPKIRNYELIELKSSEVKIDK